MFVLLAMFIANTFVVPAWAKPCDHGMAAAQIMAELATDKPCHSTQKQDEQPQNHCDGICLCAHAALNQTLFHKTAERAVVPIVGTQKFALTKTEPTTRTAPPLKRPPKLIS